MSSNDTESGKMFSFKRLAPQAAPTTSAVLELNAMLVIYDRLIGLLRETYDEGLEGLTDSLVVAAVRCREALASGMEEAAGRKMVDEMRSGLRQIPPTLRALLPGIGPRLGESFESQLGIQFSKF